MASHCCAKKEPEDGGGGRQRADVQRDVAVAAAAANKLALRAETN